MSTTTSVDDIAYYSSSAPSWTQTTKVDRNEFFGSKVSEFQTAKVTLKVIQGQ